MILKTMDGVTFEITDAEAKAVADAKVKRKSDVMIRGAMIPTSSIALYPDEMWATRQQTGRLHDGSRVTRKFGAWVSLDNPDVRINPQYYPEVANDTVLSEYEWQRRGLDQLPPGEERTECYRLPAEDKKLLN